MLLTENPPRLTTTYILVKNNRNDHQHFERPKQQKSFNWKSSFGSWRRTTESLSLVPLEAGRRAEVGCTAHQHPESSAFWLIRPQPGAHINNAVVLRRCTQRPTVSLTHRSSRRLRQQSRGPSTPPRPNTPKGDGGVTHTRYTHKVDKQVNNTHKRSKSHREYWEYSQIFSNSSPINVQWGRLMEWLVWMTSLPKRYCVWSRWPQSAGRHPWARCPNPYIYVRKYKITKILKYEQGTGNRKRSLAAKTERLRKSFYPQAVCILMALIKPFWATAFI